MRHLRSSWAFLAALACAAPLVASCSGSDSSSKTGTSTTGGAGGGGGGLPDAICNAGNHWTNGTQAFREATADWGLPALNVVGTRLEAVDFDDDGWTDLVVRAAVNDPDDFAGDKRVTWLLRNNGQHGFEDVTQSSQIRQNRTEPDANKGRPGQVWAWGDVDNDGDLDVFTGLIRDKDNPEVETSELLVNNGDGTFSLGPADSDLRRPSPALDAVAGASFVDYDRDGNLDLWVVEGSANGQPQQDRLYKGDGAGHFVDVTQSAGLTTKPWSAIADLNEARAHSNGWAGVACDLNDDGTPELLAASYGRAPNLLWQGVAGGTFVNRSIASGYAFDDDQHWQDNESARCWCKLHPTDKGCDGVPPPQYIQCTTDADAFRWDNTYDQEPFRLGGNSGTATCADVNNDGHLDLLTSEIRHWDVGESSDAAELMINTGEADVHLTRPGNANTGLDRPHEGPGWDEGIMTNSVFDFDADGWPDVYLGASDYPGNHGLLFHQVSPGKFEPVPIAQGIDHHRSHGSAVADFDHDGDLDIVVGHSLARCNLGGTDGCYATGQIRFFENLAQNVDFVKLRLTGAPGTNHAAIGARVTVKAGDVTQMQEVGGGHGHYGMQDDLTLTFGLGAECKAEVTIRWPDAALTTQSFELPAGYAFDVTQGSDPVAVIPEKR
jgi:hypothetical protein